MALMTAINLFTHLLIKNTFLIIIASFTATNSQQVKNQPNNCPVDRKGLDQDKVNHSVSFIYLFFCLLFQPYSDHGGVISRPFNFKDVYHHSISSYDCQT